MLSTFTKQHKNDTHFLNQRACDSVDEEAAITTLNTANRLLSICVGLGRSVHAVNMMRRISLSLHTGKITLRFALNVNASKLRIEMLRRSTAYMWYQ